MNNCIKNYTYGTVTRKKVCSCHKDFLGYNSHIYGYRIVNNKAGTAICFFATATCNAFDRLNNILKII